MSLDTTVPRSRWALLGAALGAAAATVASALGRPAPVRAEGGAIVVGGEYDTATSVTRIANYTNNETVLKGQNFRGGRGLGRQQHGQRGRRILHLEPRDVRPE